MRKLLAAAVVLCVILVPCAASIADDTPEPTRLLQFTAALHRIVAPGLEGVTIAVYSEQEGGEPLWSETQNVDVDASGRFHVVLGSLQRLPLNIFSSGQARWLGIQRISEEEQPRILLAAVPYALKAADADTLGGKPLSAFVLADPEVEKHRGEDGPGRPQAASIATQPFPLVPTPRRTVQA